MIFATISSSLTSEEAFWAATSLLVFALVTVIVVRKLATYERPLWWKIPVGWFAIVSLTTIAYGLLLSMPTPGYNDNEYRLVLVVFAVAASLLYRITIAALAEQYQVDGLYTRVGLATLLFSTAIGGAYLFAERNTWRLNPITQQGGVTHIIGGRFLLERSHALQFILTFPNNLQADDSGLAYVSVFERIGEGGTGSIWPLGHFSPELIAPDYEVKPVENAEYSTSFLANHSATNAVDANMLKTDVVWSWIVRPLHAGRHAIALVLRFCNCNFDPRQFQLHTAAVVRNANFSAGLTNGNYPDADSDPLINFDAYETANFQLHRPFAAEAILVNEAVAPPFSAVLTPWLAILSGLAGVISLFIGLRKKA